MMDRKLLIISNDLKVLALAFIGKIYMIVILLFIWIHNFLYYIMQDWKDKRYLFFMILW